MPSNYWPDPGTVSHSLALGIWVLSTIAGLGFAVSAAVVDVQEHRLPNRLVGWAAALSWSGLAIVNTVEGGTLGNAVTQVLVAWAVFAGPLLVLWLIKPKMIGGGDVKLATALAPLLAWPTAQYALSGLLAALVTALPHAVIAARKHTHMPLGPYLIIGTIIGSTMNLVAGS